MTPREAITTLKREFLGDSEFMELAKQMGANALEKQIPKKPIKKNPICYAKTKDGQEYFAFDYFCPNCNERIKRFEHHCPCGQAILWESEAE